MEIDIKQNKLSVGDKYEIFIDGQQRHNATSKVFRLLSEIELFEWDSPLPKLTINKNFDLLSAKYSIKTAEYKTYEFKTISFWEGHF